MTKNSKLDKDKLNWMRVRFKQNKVWLAVDDAGKPIAKNDKFLIKYQLDQDYEYWVRRNGVKPLGDPNTEIQTACKASPPEKDSPSNKLLSKAKDPTDRETICIFTDGASSGNPGPSGIGILMCFGKHEREISKFIGNTTNNVAELEAIKTGLLEMKRKDVPVRIYTDSNYAYGVLALGWKAKKNRKLVSSIKKLISSFRDFRLIKVKGHEGLEGNERADKLATSAIKNQP